MTNAQHVKKTWDTCLAGPEVMLSSAREKRERLGPVVGYLHTV